CVVSDGRAHAATRRGQSHFHFHPRAAILFLAQTTIINQTQIDNVHRDLRIVALPQLVPYIFFRDLTICGCSFWGILCLRFLQTKRIEVFLCNARQALVSCNGIASSEALRDHPLRSGRDCGLLTARNLDRFAITAQRKFSVLVHGSQLTTYYATGAENDEIRMTNDETMPKDRMTNMIAT